MNFLYKMTFGENFNRLPLAKRKLNTVKKFRVETGR